MVIVVCTVVDLGVVVTSLMSTERSSYSYVVSLLVSVDGVEDMEDSLSSIVTAKTSSNNDDVEGAAGNKLMLIYFMSIATSSLLGFGLALVFIVGSKLLIIAISNSSSNNSAIVLIICVEELTMSSISTTRFSIDDSKF